MALFNKKGETVYEADSKPSPDANQSIPGTPVTVSNEPDPAAMAVLRKLATGDLSAPATGPDSELGELVEKVRLKFGESAG